MAVLSSFLSYFRNTTHQQLLHRLRACFSTVIELPVIEVPAEGGAQVRGDTLVRPTGLGFE